MRKDTERVVNVIGVVVLVVVIVLLLYGLVGEEQRACLGTGGLKSHP